MELLDTLRGENFFAIFENDVMYSNAFVTGVRELAKQLSRFKSDNPYTRPHASIRVRSHLKQFNSIIQTKVERVSKRAKQLEAELKSTKREIEFNVEVLTNEVMKEEEFQREIEETERYTRAAMERSKRLDKLEKYESKQVAETRSKALLEITSLSYENDSLKEEVRTLKERLVHSGEKFRKMKNEVLYQLAENTRRSCATCVATSAHTQQIVWNKINHVFIQGYMLRETSTEFDSEVFKGFYTFKSAVEEKDPRNRSKDLMEKFSKEVISETNDEYLWQIKTQKDQMKDNDLSYSTVFDE